MKEGSHMCGRGDGCKTSSWSNPNFSKKIAARPRWNTLILCLLHKKNYLLSLELSHPAVPVASELIRQPARPPTRSGTMNILSGLWSNTRRGREAFGGCREGGKTRVGLNILFNYM